MKPFTRDILEHCNASLVKLGLSRQRRDLLTVPVNQEMTAAVALQANECVGSVTICLFFQLYWTPVERIFALGCGETYRSFYLPTRSVYQHWTGDDGHASLFWPGHDLQAKVSVLTDFVEARFQGAISELSEPSAILEFYLSELKYGGGYPDKSLSIYAWQNRSAADCEGFSEVLKGVEDTEFLAETEMFLARIRKSDEVATLLRTNKAEPLA